eukprot:TRINITY_DN39523_c0_g1_i1.p1 TRINITY_DN39523_c0_g1~~TRINITY_DN39523_c0_g1_i1.p1  ORF type:complete len:142 (-),score=4.27 TRINITY_DN39523_c0_g1_i1:107-472(-)
MACCCYNCDEGEVLFNVAPSDIAYEEAVEAVHLPSHLRPASGTTNATPGSVLERQKTWSDWSVDDASCPGGLRIRTKIQNAGLQASLRSKSPSVNEIWVEMRSNQSAETRTSSWGTAQSPK